MKRIEKMCAGCWNRDEKEDPNAVRRKKEMLFLCTHSKFKNEIYKNDLHHYLFLLMISHSLP